MNVPPRRVVLVRAMQAVLTGIAGGLANPAAAESAPAEVMAALLGARLQGSGELRFLGLRIYKARLWVGERAPAGDWAGLPLALELEYLRGLDGGQIADRSLAEMRRQGEIATEPAARWLAAMKKLFPDVQSGDRLTGMNLPGEGVRFFFNGAARGDVRDTEFARLFFGIWLSPKTSEPGLREKLLGSNK